LPAGFVLNKNGDNSNDGLLRAVGRLTDLVIFLCLLVVVLSFALIFNMPAVVVKRDIPAPTPDSNGLFTEEGRRVYAKKLSDSINYWSAPKLEEIADETRKRLVGFGRELVTHTSVYFGPQGKFSRGATNGMNCQNCHLESGTKIFGNNYSAVAASYPKYRGRSGQSEDVFKRIADCFRRSLNGKAPDTTSEAMRAMAEYIRWLGSSVQKGKKPSGAGFREIVFLDRAADPKAGEAVYAQKCSRCHMSGGEGVADSTGVQYKYPPLWGENSYNTGAGMYRLYTFARFVKYNMPEGATHENPQLTDAEAWDVAAYVNSRPRPGMDISRDWPRKEEKPFDHPFGPFADGFSEEQHKFGPFGPIRERQQLLVQSDLK
jgi:thiosulfate dehydrogenase